jgi:DNA-directed RNA polymerase subunit RPC12/RpoP
MQKCPNCGNKMYAEPEPEKLIDGIPYDYKCRNCGKEWLYSVTDGFKEWTY